MYNSDNSEYSWPSQHPYHPSLLLPFSRSCAGIWRETVRGGRAKANNITLLPPNVYKADSFGTQAGWAVGWFSCLKFCLQPILYWEMGLYCDISIEAKPDNSTIFPNCQPKPVMIFETVGEELNGHTGVRMRESAVMHKLGTIKNTMQIFEEIC